MHDDAGTPAKDTRTWAKAWAEAFPTAAAPDWWPLHMKFSTQFKNFHVGFTTPNVSQLQALLTVMLKWRVNKLVCPLPSHCMATTRNPFVCVTPYNVNPLMAMQPRYCSSVYYPCA